jgi:hypothetical protein
MFLKLKVMFFKGFLMVLDHGNDGTHGKDAKDGVEGDEKDGGCAHCQYLLKNK